MMLLLLACAKDMNDDTAALTGWVDVEAELYAPPDDVTYWRADAPITGPAPVQLWVEQPGVWQTSTHPTGWIEDNTVLMAVADPDDLSAVFYVWVE